MTNLASCTERLAHPCSVRSRYLSPVGRLCGEESGWINNQIRLEIDEIGSLNFGSTLLIDKSGNGLI